MRVAAVALLAITGCAGPPAGLPDAVVRDVTAPGSTGLVRIRFDGTTWTAVGRPESPTAWPGVARRAAEAVAPGGTIAWSGRVVDRDGDESFVLEKVHADGSWRSARVSADGLVLERAHSIELGEAPLGVRERLAGRTAVRTTFVADHQSAGRYRAALVEAGGTHIELELAADGTLLRRSTIRDAVLRFDGGDVGR